MSKATSTILFVKTTEEEFSASEGSSTPGFSLLKSILEKNGHSIIVSPNGMSDVSLDNVDIVIAGVPEYRRAALERSRVAEFLAQGGGVLVMTNAATMLNPPPCLNETVALAGVKFQEYLNIPDSVTRFYPHWITGNVSRIEPLKIVSLQLSAGSKVLAETSEPNEPFMVGASIGQGRFVAIGDQHWLRDDFLLQADHLTLLQNIITWLGKQNPLEIEEMQLPSEVTLGQPGQVRLTLRNQQPDRRATFSCILNSDADALITQPLREKHRLPSGETTQIHWVIQPQMIGEQHLRLVIDLEREEPLYFDRLPAVYGLAPGYFSLEIKNNEGLLQTEFKTGEYFIVDGAFHTTLPAALNFQHLLDLETGDRLIQRALETGTDKTRWHLQATGSGTNKIKLRLRDTIQFLPANVHVKPSLQDQIIELQVSMVQPLDAEIAARLKQVDPMLSEDVGRLPFHILSTDEYIKALYTGEAELRLKGMLTSARQEQWHNPELLEIILRYFLPTYVPGQGTYIPFDPDLASHLANLHIHDRRFLENNLLCSRESNDLQTSQNIAAYLLHERYGHGFFYTQTLLGQQLAILYRHPEHKPLLTLVKDSSIIVNEGFATWMELTFLNKMGREIRPAVTMRRDLLIERGKGLFERAFSSEFFQKHQPTHDSPYRQGFEFFDYIGRSFHLRCAVRVMLIACNIDLGFIEHEDFSIELRVSKDEIRDKLLNSKSSELNSQLRLLEIAQYLLDNEEKFSQEIQAVYCSQECRKSGCPLEKAITQKFLWRKP